MRIDAHQHFWKYDPDEYEWMSGPLSPLATDRLPDDLAPLLRARGLDGCVSVQVRQTEEETTWMLQLAESNDFIRGVVGWVDLRGEDVAERLAALAAPRLVGMRHIVQDEPDDRFLLRTDVLRGIREVGRAGLVYDVLIYPRQLAATCELVRVVDDQPLVLDHLGKPDIKNAGREAWEGPFRELARAQNLACKLSGLVTEADWEAWTPEQLVPYLDVALDAFGEDRLLYGSDWPVCTLAAEYDAVFGVMERWLSGLTEAQQGKILGHNAARIYGLEGSAA